MSSTTAGSPSKLRTWVRGRSGSLRWPPDVAAPGNSEAPQGAPLTEPLYGTSNVGSLWHGLYILPSSSYRLYEAPESSIRTKQRVGLAQPYRPTRLNVLLGLNMAGNVSSIKDGRKAPTFETLHIDEWLINQLRHMGVKSPTEVQSRCIPAILQGRDCIGCSKTGSGKTLAFALPIIQALSVNPYGIFALIVTPTRELAFQIADQFKVLGTVIGLKDCVVVGGMDMVEQGLQLSKRPHIVIATPGRLADHLESCNTFSLKSIRFLVLDEADRLLGGSFNDQLKTIFKVLPNKRQTLLFSATITDALNELRAIATNEPFFYEAKAEVVTVDQLDQRYVLAPTDFKDGYLVQVVHDFVEKHRTSSVMIFTDTCKSCQLISMMFQELGFECAALHSMISQKLRLASLARFKSSIVRILIATDVASRGLDIPTVDMIVNHNVPTVPKDYVHRVGRTARAGRGGVAVTFVTQRDVHLIHAIEALINTKLKEHKVNEKSVLEILTQVAVVKRESEIKLDESGFDEKREINKRKKLIMEGKDPDEEEEKKRQRKKFKKKKIKLDAI